GHPDGVRNVSSTQESGSYCPGPIPTPSQRYRLVLFSKANAQMTGVASHPAARTTPPSAHEAHSCAETARPSEPSTPCCCHWSGRSPGQRHHLGSRRAACDVFAIPVGEIVVLRATL